MSRRWVVLGSFMRLGDLFVRLGGSAEAED